jgi:RNA polymerase primary sigma factor
MQNDFTHLTQLYCNELKACKPLTKTKEMELLKKARANNKKAQNEIIKSNLRFVMKVAKSYSGKGVPMSDLISEGNLGMLRAMEKFDMSKNVRFFSYAVWWIRQYMSDFVKKRHISETIEKSDEELQTSVFKYSLSDDEDDTLNTIDVILPDEDKYEKNEKEEDDKRIVFRLLEKLDGRERYIIERYYGINCSQEENLCEISKKLDLSMERVRQIKLTAMKKMKTQALTSI